MLCYLYHQIVPVRSVGGWGGSHIAGQDRRQVGPPCVMITASETRSMYRMYSLNMSQHFTCTMCDNLRCDH